jgi:ArsR family transcriptional regulator
MLHDRLCVALGDAKRLLILYQLTNSEYSVNELSQILEIPQPTMSRHLAILHDRALISRRQQGTSVYYALAEPRIIQVLDLLRAILSDITKQRASLADFSALDAELNDTSGTRRNE